MTDFPATESADAAPAPALVFQTEGADVAPEAYVGDAVAEAAVVEEIVEAEAEAIAEEIVEDEAAVIEAAVVA